MFKKTLAIVSTIAILTAIVTGCTKKTSTTGSDIPEGTLVSKEPIKISMLYADNSSYPFKNDWLILSEIEKKTNVKLDIQVVPDSDYDQKLQMLIISGNVPDIITKVYTKNVSDFAINGLLLPVTDYIEKLPNFAKKINEWNLEAEVDQCKEADGKLYLFPGFNKNFTQSIQLGMRTDVLDELGLKFPESYEELYNTLKDIKAKYPKSLGMSERFGGDLLLTAISRSFDTNCGYSLTSGYTYDYKNKTWNFAPATDNYKEMLRYLNKLYSEGLLDKEAFTQDDNQFKQKLYNSQVMIAPFWLGEDDKFKSEIRVASNNDKAEFKPILPPAGPNGTRGTKSASRIRNGVAIPKSAEKKDYFDKLLKFVDWFYYSDEAIELQAWGVEGKTFKNLNDQKMVSDDIKHIKNEKGTINAQKEYGLNTNSLQCIVDPDYAKYSTSDEVYNLYQEEISNGMIPLDDPILKFSENESEEEKLLVSKLKDYYRESTIKFICGTMSIDNDWEQYIKQLETKGMSNLMKLVNSVWDKQK